MFKSNIQLSLFSFENKLSKKQQEFLETCKEKYFNKLIMRNIKEDDFKPLYSDKASRPNCPVNILVSALIYKELKGISFDDLVESAMFDLRVKVALGIDSIEETPFVRATLFNFQNRLSAHEQGTGISLIEKVFDDLTSDQIKELKLKTNIQRSDSTQISSNIRRYSRVQLLIEVLLRLERILDQKDRLVENIEPYLKVGSEKYMYGLKSVDLPHELEKLGKVYHTVHTFVTANETYKQTKEYINFERAYKEHFVLVDQQTSPKPSIELNSGMLQSPDDIDATYRKKNGEDSKGFVINGSETANPENPIQLLSDVCVYRNNVDDSQILNERIDRIKEKAPGLNEIHTDGAYGSEENDKKTEKLEITHITTAVRGRESEIEKTIEQTGQSENEYKVSCPGQTKISTPTRKRHKAEFDLSTCQMCGHKEKCQIFKNKGLYYFTREDYLLNKRKNNIKKIPKERRKIRPNVEATMKEIKHRTRKGKLKVRGLFKTSLFAYNVAIAINFGRIYRYILEKGLFDILNSFFALFYQNILIILSFMIFENKKYSNIKQESGNFQFPF